MKKKFPPSDDQIADAAYHLWLKANRPHGRDQEFWYEAENQLSNPAPHKRAAPKKPAAKTTAARKPAAKKPAAKAKAPARTRKQS